MLRFSWSYGSSIDGWIKAADDCITQRFIIIMIAIVDSIECCNTRRQSIFHTARGHSFVGWRVDIRSTASAGTGIEGSDARPTGWLPASLGAKSVSWTTPSILSKAGVNALVLCSHTSFDVLDMMCIPPSSHSLSKTKTPWLLRIRLEWDQVVTASWMNGFQAFSIPKTSRYTESLEAIHSGNHTRWAKGYNVDQSGCLPSSISIGDIRFGLALHGLWFKTYAAYFTASPQICTKKRQLKIMCVAVFKTVRCIRSAFPYETG